jgi:hypothetical protein
MVTFGPVTVCGGAHLLVDAMGVDLEGKTRLDVPPGVVQRVFPRNGKSADVFETMFHFGTEHTGEEIDHLARRSGVHGAFSKRDDGSD